MLHGPGYRSGDNPDLADYRARQRFGHHKGDQATHNPKGGSLTLLIFLAFLAVTALVFLRNVPLLGELAAHLRP